MLNKEDIIRGIARRSRATLFPLTIDEVTGVINSFMELVADEVAKPDGRIEMEGLLVIGQNKYSVGAKLSPALKRKIAALRAQEAKRVAEAN